MNDRTSRGERVSSGSGWGCDDQSVRSLVRQEVTVNLHSEFNHARCGASVDDDIVHRKGAKNAGIISDYFAQEKTSKVLCIVSLEHRRQCGLYLIQSDIRYKTQATLVDADQGDPVGGELTTKAEHGAVPAHHNCQVAGFADLVDVLDLRVGEIAACSGLLFNNNVCALEMQKMS